MMRERWARVVAKTRQSHIPGRLDLTQSVLGSHDDLESMEGSGETKSQARGDVSAEGGAGGEARSQRLRRQN